MFLFVIKDKTRGYHLAFENEFIAYNFRFFKNISQMSLSLKIFYSTFLSRSKDCSAARVFHSSYSDLSEYHGISNISDFGCPLRVCIEDNIFGFLRLRVFFCCRKNLHSIDPSTITGSTGEISRKIHFTIAENRESDQSGNRSVCRIRWPWKAPSAYVSVGT